MTARRSFPCGSERSWSDAAVREELLTPSEGELTALLASLHGKVQLSIRAFYREETLLRDVARRAPAAARLGERVQQLPEPVPYYDMLRLGELIAEEVARRRQRDTQVLIEHLEGLAAASHVEPRTTSERAVNVAFLVERDRVEQFSAAVKRLQAHLGDRMRIRYIGPLPPYSFAGGGEAVTVERGPLGRLP